MGNAKKELLTLVPNEDIDTPLFKKSIDVSNISDLMMTKKIGEIVTFLEIQNVVYNKDEEVYKGRASYVVRKLLQKGYVFHSIKNIGYKRAEDNEIVEKSPSNMKSARKKIQRNITALYSSNDKNLSNELKTLKNTQLAVAGLIMHLTKTKEVKKIEQKSMNNTLTFDPRENLKYLSGS